ncbi:bowman-birk serine protease inhibitor family protein (macronuclear) [Tetrahymena thermophila SB210]|uniref:Bowman-birk serine protease inhibitor family protein n=1 Tax=Tetrahymena thermophila (strain SB210) TaxID=312017 RepID=Q24F28_TETTS|nr:bowman-birk serine protease inhibitor family protein [Tetrahymena thermophila SB210]EAS06379.3 bowman-birk serine protease inhibitor family protein [Tetrahymena thermophila SB210]|eukprot:XP_001026624.3 bowman-birk serine protease inhibitor family protein [Tetrahymena thermophila SB210]
MKVMNYILIYLLLHFKLFEASSINSNSGQSQIVKDFAYAPCDPSNIQEQLGFSYYGINLLPIDDLPYITSFSISGWFLFRQIYNQNYDILTVFENTSTFLFKIQQNFLAQQVSSTLSDSSQVFSKSNLLFQFSLQNWYFCQFSLEYNQQQSKMYLKSYIYQSQTQYLYSSLQFTRSSSFQSSGLIFNLGNSQGGSNISPSCTLLKQVYLYWNVNQQSAFQLKYDQASMDTFIFWSYDFAYTQQNKDYFIEDIPPGNKLPLPFKQASSFQIINNQFVQTDYINCKEQNGFVISFHFKFDASTNLSNGITIYLVKFVQLQNLMQISVVNGELIFSAHFRYYKGFYFTDNSSCFLQGSKSDNSCIICKSDYLIDYQNNFTCIQPSSINYSTLIDSVKDWYPKQFQCQQDMILDRQTGICKCRHQFYRKGDQCYQCKNYCQGCIDANTCIQMDPNRMQNGACSAGHFDDGYSCLLIKFNLDSQQNFYRTLFIQQAGGVCNQNPDPSTQVTYPILRILTKVGQLFAFQFKIITPEAYSCLAYLADNLGNEVFTVMFKTQTVTSPWGTTGSISYYYVAFLANGVALQQFYDQNTGAKLNISANPNNAFFDRFKGILFSPQNSGQISNLSLQNRIPTISLEYYIVPYGTRAFIRICYNDLQYFYNSKCQDTVYSMLFLNQPNTLQIIYRNKSPYFSDIFIQEFEIICNYQVEIMTFTNSRLSSITTDTLFLFEQTQDQNFGNFLIYLNQIEIHVGDGSYYEDISNYKQCFLFKNFYDMKCIVLKSGFLLYNNVIITQQDCLSYSQYLGTLHVINYSAQQCIDTKLTNLCIEIYSQSQNIKCKTCKYPNADPNNNCLCPSGMFFDSTTLSCQKCNPYCLTCKTSSDNCTSCLYTDQAPPQCNCIQKNMYLDTNHVCQYCSYKCLSCEFQSDLCTQCGYNRETPPLCNCSPQYQEINQTCEPLSCDKKCESCQNSSQNCATCKQGRIQPPNCVCDINYIENLFDGTCVPCPQGQFYDSTQQACIACIAPCKSCVGQANNCLECQEGFIYEKNDCKCQEGFSVAKIQNNKYDCLKNMGVSLDVIYSKSLYYLHFKFDLDIENIKIPSNLYSISNPTVSGNKLIVKINIMKSFQTLSGKVKFFDTSQIVDVSQNYVLDRIYQINPLSFTIGPFVFNESTLGSGFVNQILDNLEYKNGGVNKMAQEYQLILYLINTAQPTLLFFLLKAQYPPNLYKFYQILGKLIFPEIVDYQLILQIQNYLKNKFRE